MIIKTYVADNVQEAFYKVKSEMGKDAIILQTKYVKKGGFLGLFSKRMVEVVAANDINTTGSSAKKQMSIPPYIPPIKDQSGKNIEELKSEINEVKTLLKNLYEMKSNFSETSSVEPHFKPFYDKMTSMELHSEVIDEIFKNVSKRLNGNSDEKLVYNLVKEELCSYLNKIEPIETEKHSVVAFVGPTGVGKTTTIAKLAANFTLYQKKKVAMITADTFRVGAIEQLKLYGELLEIPVVVAYRPEDLKNIMKELTDYDILLVDTMGSSPNNRMQIRKMKNILDTIEPTEIHLVLSATTKTGELDNILENYRELKYNKILITKLDETRTYGIIANALSLSKCCLSYITMGQNVPDDIKIASSENIAELILGESKYE